MRIILHGVLAERYGAEHSIQTDVPADAIEGLSRQLPDWPRDLAIRVVDYPTERLLRSQTDDEEIHLVPAMFGGGGFTRIAIGAALIVTAFAVGGPFAPFLFAMGASMVLSGVTTLLMKAPTVDKSNDPPASKYLGINQNTTAIGTPIALAWGRVKLTGHWLSLQSDADHLVTTSFPVSTS